MEMMTTKKKDAIAWWLPNILWHPSFHRPSARFRNQLTIDSFTHKKIVFNFNYIRNFKLIKKISIVKSLNFTFLLTFPRL